MAVSYKYKVERKKKFVKTHSMILFLSMLKHTELKLCMCSKSMKIWTGRINIKFSLVVTSGEGRKGVEERSTQRLPLYL